jgi:hypothetical protein
MEDQNQEWQPVLPNSSCLSGAFQRACVAAVHGGFVPHFMKSLHESGFRGVTEAFIAFVASDCSALWGVSDPSRAHCFHCGRKSAGAICTCIEGSLPRDFVDLNNEIAVAALDPTAPARTFLCSGCGQLAVTLCGEVARAQAARGVWYPHTRCGRCHGGARKTRKAAPKKAAPRTNLRELLQARVEELSQPVAQA